MTLKKTFAIGIAFIMLLASVPVNAVSVNDIEADVVLEETESAGIYNDTAGTLYEEEIKAVSEYGAMTGYPDGTFRPDENASRSEFVVMLTRLMSLSHIAQTMDSSVVFDDVTKDFWASREIQIIRDKNILNGYGDNTFRPDEPVSRHQAIKLIVETLGYGKAAADKGGWPLGYLMVAEEINLADGLDINSKGNITRGEIAKLINKALKTPKSDGTYLADTIGELNFYVSPTGDDKNPGTEEKPWKTANKAAKTARAGTTVIFEDGEYRETVPTVVEHSGTEGKPITFRARNKHKAVIKYNASMQAVKKWQVWNKDYVNVRDFHFTQEKRATDSTASATADIFLDGKSANYIEFTGNKCTNVYEEGIKLTYVTYFLLDGNEVIDADHEGFDIFCCSNGIVRNNTITDAGRVGFMLKGNSHNNTIYNNYLYFSKKMANDASHAIGLGGSSDNTSPHDIGRGTGFEGYNMVAYNNLVVSEPGILPNGIVFMASTDCHAYNNIVINAEYAITMYGTYTTQKGWDWDVPVINPTVKNNIFMDCAHGVRNSVVPQNPVFENNIWYNVKDALPDGAEVANPMFADAANGDFRLLPGSPAIDAGFAVPSEVPGLERSIYGEPIEKTVKIPMIDYDGNERTGTWDIGIYSAGN